MLAACRDFTNEINPGINPYIYGGEEAQPGEFPHMVGTVGGGDLAEPFDVPEDQPLLFRALPQRGRPIARQPPPPEGRARPGMLRGLDEYPRGARDEDVRSRARLARQSRTEFRQTSPSRDRESFGAFEEETTSRPRLVRVTNTSVWEGKAGGRPGNWRVPPDSVWARPPQGPSAAAGPAGAPGLGATQADQPKQPDGKAGIALYVIGGNEAFDGEFKHMVGTRLLCRPDHRAPCGLPPACLPGPRTRGQPTGSTHPGRQSGAGPRNGDAWHDTRHYREKREKAWLLVASDWGGQAISAKIDFTAHSPPHVQ